MVDHRVQVHGAVDAAAARVPPLKVVVIQPCHVLLVLRRVLRQVDVEEAVAGVMLSHAVLQRQLRQTVVEHLAEHLLLVAGASLAKVPVVLLPVAQLLTLRAEVVVPGVIGWGGGGREKRTLANRKGFSTPRLNKTLTNHSAENSSSARSPFARTRREWEWPSGPSRCRPRARRGDSRHR